MKGAVKEEGEVRGLWMDGMDGRKVQRGGGRGDTGGGDEVTAGCVCGGDGRMGGRGRAKMAVVPRVPAASFCPLISEDDCHWQALGQRSPDISVRHQFLATGR